jgi:hypothetical protein
MRITRDRGKRWGTVRVRTNHRWTQGDVPMAPLRLDQPCASRTACPAAVGTVWTRTRLCAAGPLGRTRRPPRGRPPCRDSGLQQRRQRRAGCGTRFPGRPLAAEVGAGKGKWGEWQGGGRTIMHARVRGASGAGQGGGVVCLVGVAKRKSARDTDSRVWCDGVS